MTRPFGPVPFMVCKSIFNSRDNRRTPGEAKALSMFCLTFLCFFGSTAAIISGFDDSLFSFTFCLDVFLPVVSTVNRHCPAVTVDPGAISTFFTFPSISAGISIDAFSDSRTRIISSTFIVFPGETKTSLTSAESIPSPRSGKSISLIIFHTYTVIGLGFSLSILYFFITFSATSMSNLPSVAKAQTTVKTI